MTAVSIVSLGLASLFTSTSVWILNHGGLFLSQAVKCAGPPRPAFYLVTIQAWRRLPPHAFSMIRLPDARQK